MEELNEELSQQILDLIDEAYNAYSKEIPENSINILQEAWNLLPDNQEDYEEGYLVIHEFVETYFSVGDYLETEKWIEIYLKSDNLNRNFGIAEFYAGKTAFELGKFEDAKNYFQIAEKKSEGRVWKGNDATKYFKFYKEKN